MVPYSAHTRVVDENLRLKRALAVMLELHRLEPPQMQQESELCASLGRTAREEEADAQHAASLAEYARRKAELLDQAGVLLSVSFF